MADPRAVIGHLPAAVADYLNHVRAERGLATNTVSAYRRDLTRYMAFLQSRGSPTSTASARSTSPSSSVNSRPVRPRRRWRATS
ncbi:site-specific integrase [Tessaracoccus sp. HDW20]|nr:site-specific integrase [Tessaracoccus coleopterorum]